METDGYLATLQAIGGLFIGLGLVIAIIWVCAAWERRRRFPRRAGSRSLAYSFILGASDWTPGGVGSHGSCDHGGGWGHGDGGGGCDGGH